MATQAEQHQVADEQAPEATHSGRLMVRMPPSLHDELALEAEREGVSLNAFLVGVLAGAIAWRAPDGGGRAPAEPPRWAKRTLAANLLVVGALAVMAAVLLVVALIGG
jgi:hypothetical protein